MTLSKASLREVYAVCNRLFTLLSIIVVCGMIGIMGYWIGQPTFFYTVTKPVPEVFVLSTDGGIYYPNLLISGAGKAVFEQWIEDSEGNIVHRYPAIRLDAESSSRAYHESVTIPPLAVGTYIVRAKMVSQPNPLKMTQFDLTLGRIEIIAKSNFQ